MSFLEFSTNNITDQEAQVIADAYFRAQKDPAKMAEVLETDRFDLNLLMHPLVKKRIIAEKAKLNTLYSLEDHLAKLQEIRDGAMNDENWKTALSAEVAVGKAAGLYEPKALVDPSGESAGDVSKLSTEELRRRLASVTQVLSAPMPTDDSPEDEYDTDTQEI